jgi:hypothetical protein
MKSSSKSFGYIKDYDDDYDFPSRTASSRRVSDNKMTEDKSLLEKMNRWNEEEQDDHYGGRSSRKSTMSRSPSPLSKPPTSPPMSPTASPLSPPPPVRATKDTRSRDPRDPRDSRVPRSPPSSPRRRTPFAPVSPSWSPQMKEEKRLRMMFKERSTESTAAAAAVVAQQQQQQQRLHRSMRSENDVAYIKGSDGVDGRDGIDGKDGTDGRDGKDGADGRDGKDGRSAATVRATTPIGRSILTHANGRIRTFDYYLQTCTDLGQIWGQISSLYHLPDILDHSRPPTKHCPIIMTNGSFVNLTVELSYFSIPPADPRNRINMPDKPIAGSITFKIVCLPAYNRRPTDESGRKLPIIADYSCIITEPNKDKVKSASLRRSITMHNNVYFEAEVFPNTRGDLLKLKSCNYHNIADIYYLDLRVGYQPTPDAYDLFQETKSTTSTPSRPLTSSIGESEGDESKLPPVPPPTPKSGATGALGAMGNFKGGISIDYRLYWTAHVTTTYHDI